MRVIYFDTQSEAELVQERILTALRAEGKVSSTTVRYSDVIECEGQYCIYVLDEHLDYLTNEERVSAKSIEDNG